MTYSIRFRTDDGKKYAVDWDYLERGLWTVTEQPSFHSMGEWHPSVWGDHARLALLRHFNLPQHLPETYVRRIGPATLARLSGSNPRSDNLGPTLHALDVVGPEDHVFPPDFGMISAEDAGEIRAEILQIEHAAGAELIAHLAKHPEHLYEINPRDFERIVADILADMGAEVRLTPATRDGGRDVLAVFKTPLGEHLSVVECKRYAANRRIGEDIIRSLMFVMDRRDLASQAMIVTTSFFTKDAVALAREFKWRLTLQDFDGLKDWLQRYGRWGLHEDASLWLPKRPGAVVVAAQQGVAADEAPPRPCNANTLSGARPLPDDTALCVGGTTRSMTTLNFGPSLHKNHHSLEPDQEREGTTPGTDGDDRKTGKPHVFVSYLKEDEVQVGALCRDLIDAGHRIWLDKNDILPGVDWRLAIRRAIHDGAYFIACFSAAYANRNVTYMNEELQIAIEQLRQMSDDAVWFIPVKLSECSIPQFEIRGGKGLDSKQWVDLHANWTEGVRRILDALGMQKS